MITIIACQPGMHSLRFDLIAGLVLGAVPFFRDIHIVKRQARDACVPGASQRTGHCSKAGLRLGVIDCKW